MFCGGERHLMKQQDIDIERERDRERKLERETLQESPTTDIIEHFSHPHPLIYTQPDYAGFSCNSCAGSGRGHRYHCAQCNFDMHKVCARRPITWLLHHMPSEEIQKYGVQWDVIETYGHSQHSVVTEYRRRSFKCDLCKNSGNGLRFLCDDCKVGFHQVCALNPTRLISHLHPLHELELKLRPHFTTCNLCGSKEPGNNRMYRCKDCQFYLHPVCSQWPLYLVHPLHPPHPLMLRRSSDIYDCAFCRGPMVGYKYRCTKCALDFDLGCIWHQSKLGLGEELRQNYTGQQVNVLPVTNLTLPDFYQRQSQGSRELGHPTLAEALPHFPGIARTIAAAIALPSSD